MRTHKPETRELGDYLTDESGARHLAEIQYREAEARWRKDRAKLKAILSYRQAAVKDRSGRPRPGVTARDALDFLVGKRCDGEILARMILAKVQPIERTETAGDRQRRKEQLATLLNALERITRGKALLASVIRDHVRPSPEHRYFANLEPALRILTWAVKESLSLKPLVHRFNPREQQWLRLLDYVHSSTGKYYPTKVAVLANAMLSAALPSHAEITRAYLLKLVFRRDENKRKWGTLPPKLSRKAFQP